MTVYSWLLFDLEMQLLPLFFYQVECVLLKRTGFFPEFSNL